jgi:hypothetical protein
VSRFSTFCIFKRNIVGKIGAKSSKSVEKENIFFGPLASSAEVMIFRVMQYIEVKKKFVHIVGHMGIKRRRIL